MADEDDYRDFAQKIALVFYHQGVSALMSANKKKESVKGFHLPYNSVAQRLPTTSLERLTGSFQKVSNKVGQVKPSSKISTDKLFESRSIASDFNELFDIAFNAHRFCMKQDLHLLKFKQLFLEHGLSVKQVMNWKLPKSLLNKKSVEKWMVHLNAMYEEVSRDFKIDLLEKKKSEESEHLDLLKYFE
ncbi:MAG: hypothetical protein MRY21_04260 [Simkaniaceae bacterium]|nr:hypothetical protein [Simkaniaceae bacterium]